jgi:hypothetical protein
MSPGIYEQAKAAESAVANGFPVGKDGQTDPINKEAMSYYLRTITPPEYTGREPYTLGEGVSPEEWVRFFNFYKSNKNAPKSPEVWTTSGNFRGKPMPTLLKKGSGSRKFSLRDYDLFRALYPPEGADTTPGELPKYEEPIIPGHEDAGSVAPRTTERSRAEIAKSIMDLFAKQKEAAEIKTPPPVGSAGTEGESTGDDEQARERMRRMLSARNAIKAETSKGSSYTPKDALGNPDKEAVERDAKIKKAIEEKKLVEQMNEDDRINALSDDELLNEFLKSQRKPGDMDWQDSMKAGESADSKSTKMPSWMARTRKAEDDGTSIQEIEQQLFGISQRPKGSTKARDSKEIKDELTWGKPREQEHPQYGADNTKFNTEAERAAFKAKLGLTDAQLKRAIKAGLI